MFEGATGRSINAGAGQSRALATQGVMIGLHAGRFAGWGLRWLYFLSGVSGAIMVGSGLVLWTVKRRGRLPDPARPRSEEHTSELQSLMRISYAVFCLQKKKKQTKTRYT